MRSLSSRRKDGRRARSLRAAKRRRFLQLLLIGALATGGGVAWGQAPVLPTGGEVVAGQTAISSIGNTMDINAATSRAIVNWDSFNVGAGNIANFNLPDANSAILNRVTSANMPSTIAGAVNSNGNVYLVNPSGIMVTSSGMVNTNGFTASTFDIANSEFMAGGALTFADNGSSASIVNNGSIHTGDGGAHLIANQIANNGMITSTGGNITLSGGGSVTLDNGVTYVQPSMETLASGISPTAGLIRNTGTIRATGAATSGGEVYLVNPNGKIMHDGTIAAQNIASNGNSIGGHVQMEAEEITLTNNASIDASGTHGGGDVLVGGDWQGTGEMTQATSVTLEAGATIDVSATVSGDGGKIVLWSDLTKDSITKAFGSLIARGGQLFGNGGQIETSGSVIDTSGIQVDAGATNGSGGLWLIDPYNYIIDAIAASNIVSALNTGTSVTVTTTANNAAHGSSGNNADQGDITVSGNIVTGAMAGDATLELQAARHIRIEGNTGIDATQNGNTRALSVKLWADIDDSGDGINIFSSPTIATNGGSLTVGNGNTATIGESTVQVGGDIYVNGNVAQSIQTNGGNITVNGETIIANSNGLTVDAGSGDILFDGVVNSGNTYAAVNSTLHWVNAVNAAKSGTGDQTGDSYLATITSRLENAIAGLSVNYQQSWLGGRRVVGIGTDNAWRWVTGPEGLQNGGDGLIYAIQDPEGGVTAQNDLFNNWNPGEPNNWTGSGIGAFNTDFESAHQFTGSQGRWNDLPPTSTTLEWYVRETNATPSPLTVNTTGTVDFGGGIGGSKALASLEINGSNITVNGNAMVTTGTQAFGSSVTLNSLSTARVEATSLVVDGGMSITGAGGNVTIDTSIDATGDISIESGNDLNLHGAIVRSGAADTDTVLKADRHIVLNSDASVTTSDGSQNIHLWADTDDSGDGIITMLSQAIGTSGGWLQFGNGNTATIGGSSVQVGGDVYFSNTVAQSVSTDGGDITVNGETIVANTQGLTVDSGGGNILFDGSINSGNQYTYVDGPDGQANSWDWARTDARNGTAGGSTLGDSYLVTITSRLENAIAGIAAGYRGAWIGAYRSNPAGSYNWQWIDGPEAGENFFVQSGSGGGTAQPGWYSNFGAGEPNGALNASGESRGQFFGDQGLWNDLAATETFAATQDSQFSVLGYVRETNLAPSSVTINSGTGAVTFDGSIGGGKALSSLNVVADSITVSGNALLTTGAQEFSSAVTATSVGNLTVGGTSLNIGGAGDALLLKATGNVTVNSGMVVTTNGGAITLWGDSDASNQGYIWLNEDVTLDSRTQADRTAGTHTTGGGAITLAGGADNGSGAPSGYAFGTNSSVDRGGVNFGDQTLGGHTNNTEIYSGGGNVVIRGQSSHVMMGFNWVDGGTINSGNTGLIDIAGVNSSTGHAVEIGAWNNGGIAILQSGAGAGAISISGTTASTSGQGIQSSNLVAQATGSNGSISLNGTSGNGGSGLGIFGNMELLASSGPITLNGGTQGISLFGAIGRKAATPVTTSSSDVTLTGDYVNFYGATNLNTSGIVTVQPSGTSFSSTLSWPLSNLTLSSDVSGLTLGKVGNTAGIVLGTDVTTSGAQNYFGPVTLSGNRVLTTTDSAITFGGTINSDGTARTLTVNAGNGSVTFDGAVGESTALASLTTTAGAGIHINGGQVNTTGVQTYNSPVLLGAHTNFATIQNDIIFGSTVDSDSVNNQWNLTATITPGNTYYWVDWTNWDEASKTATGTITVGGDVITVTYHNPAGINLAQTSGGTNYWTGFNGGAFAGASPYVSSNVANGPSTSDIIQLQFAGSQTLSFSESVENLAFSIVSMNGNGYGFDQDFTIEGNSGINGAGPGYYGSGTFVKSIVGNTFQLNDGGANGASIGGNSEPHGMIRFGNAFSQLTWNSLSNEEWNGFTVGVSGTSSTAGAVQFNGLVGDAASMGAITVNAGLQTTAAIADASSFNVSGLASLGGGITTSGNQSFGSALTFGSDIALTTTGNGGVSTSSTIDGAHALTIQTAGTGDVSLSRAVGSTNALTGLTITTDQLSAANIALATNAAMSLTTGGTSSITGVISGTDATLSKAGSGTLSLSGTNTYSGGTTITGGKLSIASDANLGTAPGSATAGHLTLNGGTLLVTGNTTLDSNRGIELSEDDGTVEVASSVTAQYAGIVDGAGDLTKTGAGKLALSGTSTYTGATQVSGGIVETNNLSALGDNSAVTVDNTSGASLNLLSNLTIGSLAGGGTTGGNVSLGSSKLTTGGDNTSTTFAGIISGTGSLDKAGSGDFTLTANNTYTGVTTIAAGQLILENDAPTFATSGIDGPGSLTVRSSGDSFSSAFNTSSVPLGGSTGLGGLTIGKATNTADVTIGSASSVDGAIEIHGGNIAINGGLTATGSNRITLGASGNITDGASGFVSAESLLVEATGATTLDSVSNAIGTFAFDGGSLSLTESDGFTVGTVGTTNGINAAGTVNVSTLAGDLTVSQNIATTDTSAAAITLNAGRSTAAGTATGGNIVFSGSPTITTGTGGRATFFTGSIADSTGLTDLIGSGSGNFRYNSDEAASNYSLALGTGLFGIYREQPTIDVSVADATITYGDSTASLTPSVSNGVNGDTVSQVFARPGITIGGTTSTSGDPIVGDHALTSTGTTTSQLGYGIGTTTGGTLTVNQKQITTPLVIDNKEYDATTAATFSASANGAIAGDVIDIGGTAAFVDKHVGTGKTVNITGLNLTGTDAGNYVLANTTDTSIADITAKSITVSGLTANDKVYDATTTATIDHSGVTFTGMIGGDDLLASGSTGTFADKIVGTAKTVTLSGTTYGGADVNNYTFVDQATTTADITQKSVTISGLTAANREYDGTTTATADASGITFNGIVSGDDLTASGTVGAFVDKNVGTAKTVNLSGTTYGGADLGNYSIVDQSTSTANITARSITVIGIAANDKVYDGSTTATVDTSGIVFNGMVGGDDLSASGTTGAYSDKNVGNHKTVTLSGTIYGGTDVGNYTFTDQSTATADIAQKSVTVSGLAANDKVYDGTTVATIDHSGVVFNGMVTGDDLTASGTNGSFADKNAATNKSVSLSGTNYGGSDVGNYAFTDQATSTADITPKSIFVNGITAANKTYDGTTVATVDLSGISFDGMVTGDDLTATGTTGSFSDKHVDSAKPVALSGTSYGGADLSNYSITDQAVASADITTKSLTVSGIVANDKVYDGTTSATVDINGISLNGLIAGDDVQVSGTTGVFSDKNAGINKTVNLSGSQYSGGDAGNYSIADQSNTTADIAQKSLTVSGITAADKVYDGTTQALVDNSQIAYTGLVAGDDFMAQATSGTFAQKDVGGAITVHLGYGTSGTDVANYNISFQPTTAADITPKSLVIDLSGQGTKVYDGNSSIDLTGVTPSLAGIVAGDSVTVTAGNVTGFVDKNVGTNKEVVYSGFGISGADVGNYFLQSGSAPTAASITPKPITVSGLQADSRVYDGTTSTTVDHNGVVFNGMVSGDDLNANGTVGAFNDKHVGVGKAVMLTGTVYGGADAGNYSYTSQSTSAADVTPKAMTISGIAAHNKTYDGSVAATVDTSGMLLDGLVSGDVVNVNISANFDNKNVGTDKTVGLTITETGADAGNYAFTRQQTALADILRLASVMWIGGTSGDWSDPANWAGGAIPDLANVANIIIPNGVTPIFDSNVNGPVNIDSLSGGNLQVDSGTLSVANDATLGDYTQNGGVFNVGGNFSFNQTTLNDGTLNVTGNTTGGTFHQNGGTAGFGGNLGVDDYEQTNGDTTVGGTFTFDTATVDGGTLNVTGNTTGGTFHQNGGTVGFGGNLDVDDYEQTNGDTTVGGTFTFGTATVDGGTLDVTGNTTGGTFNQNGGTVGFGGNLDVDDYEQTNGDTTVGGTFTFDTGTVDGGTLNVLGDVDAGNFNQDGGAINIDGRFQVNRLNRVSGDLQFAAISGPLADDFSNNVEQSVTDTNTRYTSEGNGTNEGSPTGGFASSLLRVATNLFERWFSSSSGSSQNSLEVEVSPSPPEASVTPDEVFIRERNGKGLDEIN